VTDRPFGFLVDDFLDIIAKKVLSDQQSYVSVTHARLLWRSRGESPYTWPALHVCARLPQPAADEYDVQPKLSLHACALTSACQKAQCEY